MATAATTCPSGPVLSIPNCYRSASPTRVKLAAAAAARSPGKSVSASSTSAVRCGAVTRSRRSCMCSPTNHPGSFRCSLHKERKQEVPASHGRSKPASPPSPSSPASSSGAVESRTWARRALASCSQSQNRRRAAGGFRPRPSRLSAVSFAGASDNQ